MFKCHCYKKTSRPCYVCTYDILVYLSARVKAESRNPEQLSIIGSRKRYRSDDHHDIDIHYTVTGSRFLNALDHWRFSILCIAYPTLPATSGRPQIVRLLYIHYMSTRNLTAGVTWSSVPASPLRDSSQTPLVGSHQRVGYHCPCNLTLSSRPSDKHANNAVYEFWRHLPRWCLYTLLAQNTPMFRTAILRGPTSRLSICAKIQQLRIGVKTQDGTEHESDESVFATGFDAVLLV